MVCIAKKPQFYHEHNIIQPARAMDHFKSKASNHGTYNNVEIQQMGIQIIVTMRIQEKT